ASFRKHAQYTKHLRGVNGKCTPRRGGPAGPSRAAAGLGAALVPRRVRLRSPLCARIGGSARANERKSRAAERHGRLAGSGELDAARRSARARPPAACWLPVRRGGGGDEMAGLTGLEPATSCVTG